MTPDPRARTPVCVCFRNPNVISFWTIALILNHSSVSFQPSHDYSVFLREAELDRNSLSRFLQQWNWFLQIRFRGEIGSYHIKDKIGSTLVSCFPRQLL